MSADCGAHEMGEFYDTISSELATGGHGGKTGGADCVIRFPIQDLGGHVVMQSHILTYEVREGGDCRAGCVGCELNRGES